MCRWSGGFDKFGLCSFMFSFVASSKLIIFVFFYVIRSWLVQYAYVSIESIDCILLSPFELKGILLISLQKHYVSHF